MSDLPTRPILRWHGGKWLLAPWIISHFPPHKIYVEPFGGAASVLMQKPPLPADVYNDLDRSTINVFRVLRDPVKAADLQRRLELTPFARAEFEFSYEPPTDDVDKAHKDIILTFFGFGTDSLTRACRTGFRSKLSDERALPAQSWKTYADSIPVFAQRFKGVLIEQIPAIDLMPRFDTVDTLFYVDPPYLHATRSSLNGRSSKTHGYVHELTTSDHVDLLAAIERLIGYVVVSGYPSELYDDTLAGWLRVERPALADGAKPRTEVLWINPQCAAALERQRRSHQHEMFEECP